MIQDRRFSEVYPFYDAAKAVQDECFSIDLTVSVSCFVSDSSRFPAHRDLPCVTLHRRSRFLLPARALKRHLLPAS